MGVSFSFCLKPKQDLLRPVWWTAQRGLGLGKN
jgi:hypothetical protein